MYAHTYVHTLCYIISCACSNYKTLKVNFYLQHLILIFNVNERPQKIVLVLCYICVQFQQTAFKLGRYAHV